MKKYLIATEDEDEPDKTQAHDILHSMQILTGYFTNIAVFVDEMTVFNIKSSETSLGGRY